MNSSTDSSRVIRNRWVTDYDGARMTDKRDDESIELTVDWAPEIGGDVIRSVSYSDSGITRSGTSNTATSTTTTVSGLGETEISLTLSSGRVVQRVYRFCDAQGYGQRTPDYRP